MSQHPALSITPHFPPPQRRVFRTAGSDEDKSIGESAFASLHDGEEITGRTSPLLYLTICFQGEHFIGPPEFSDGPLIIPFLASLFWNAIVGVFAYRIWFIPLRQRRLIRCGTAAPGHITSLHSLGKGRRRIVYSFTTAQGNFQIGSHEIESGITAQADMPCTVFYNSDQPWRSVAYQFSGLQIDG
jgi:hypothetical protein